MSEESDLAISQVQDWLKYCKVEEKASFHLERIAEQLNPSEVRRWFFSHPPMAIVTGAVQVRHSTTKECTQVKGLIMDFQYPCPGCGTMDAKDIVHTKHWWLIICKHCPAVNGEDAIWWKGRANVMFTPAVEEAVKGCCPYTVAMVEHARVPKVKRKQKEDGFSLIQEEKGDGVFTLLVYVKKGMEQWIPANRFINV